MNIGATIILSNWILSGLQSHRPHSIIFHGWIIFGKNQTLCFCPALIFLPVINLQVHLLRSFIPVVFHPIMLFNCFHNPCTKLMVAMLFYLLFLWNQGHKSLKGKEKAQKRKLKWVLMREEEIKEVQRGCDRRREREETEQQPQGLKNETYTEVPQAAVPWAATWGWLQRQVSPHRAQY